MIPDFPRFKSIDYPDRRPIEDFLRRCPPAASEYTFTNLFAWQKANRYRIAAFRGGFLVLRNTARGDSFLQPLVPGGFEAALETCLEFLAKKNQAPVVERVGEDFLARLGFARRRFTAAPDRDNFDYVYHVSELVALRGEKFHAKLNLWNQFSNKYRYRYRRLDGELLEPCRRFVREWCERRECEEVEGLKDEKCAVFRMLRYFPVLGAAGGVIEVDGKVVAATLGERLNPDTLVVHVEKADEKLTGVYQAINREFLADFGAGYTCVNREQDLGVPGLRRAKKSYNPARMVRKYVITPR